MTKQETKLMTRAEHVEALARGFQEQPHWSAYSRAMAVAAVDYAIRHGMPVAPDPLPRITRGVVLETPEDAKRWEIPDKTIFRDCHDEARQSSSRTSVIWPVAQWGIEDFPLTCVDVLGEVD